MANYVRRLVSGNKARFKDAHLDIELDLVYVTDHIIIMGFPATGVEGFYRNHRDDAKRFLDHRHGHNYWVFNFCPLRENSYPASFFGGRVSRYPFPDHHAPPLAMLPLAAREMRTWLSGSTDRVIVLHCKAGKGRSGTLTCAYLLSLDESPTPPKLERSLTKKEWAKRRAEQVMDTVETEDMGNEADDPQLRGLQDKLENASITRPDYVPETSSDGQSETPMPTTVVDKPLAETPKSISPVGTYDNIDPHVGRTNMEEETKPKMTLEDVLALHTSRRMKAPSSPDKKLKHGVSIPSQRRWLQYWSLVLANAAPPNFWAQPNLTNTRPKLRVRLTEIKVRMRELGGVKMNLLRVADRLLEKTSGNRSTGRNGTSDLNRGKGLVWVSLARYSDELVEKLEQWETYTRDENGKMGMRREGSEYMPANGGEEESLRDLFSDGRWDKGKMIRSFARLGDVDGVKIRDQSDDGTVVVHTLRPLSDKRWEAIQTDIERSETKQKSNNEFEGLSTASSMIELHEEVLDERSTRADEKNREGIVLDAEREVRAKLYIGSVFMGWFWFVPTFHMPQPPPSSPSTSDSSAPSTRAPTHLTLTRKELDFPLGAGSALIDVDVSLEWLVPQPGGTQGPQPPKTQTSEDSRRGIGGELQPGASPAGAVAAGIQAVISDASGREAVESVQAGDQ